MARTNIRAAVNDLVFSHDLDLHEAAERHITPDYTQRTDGHPLDHAAFLAHVANIRATVASGSIEVHDELVDGDRYADRHTMTVTNKDGSSFRMEVYLFAEFAADGRFRHVDETTLLLDGVAP
ncbi:nuclear transport factor 2 family protein [Kitasatospora sp. NPDC101183]|uniref:nuclear transport factor 2 family protein n=1 Tax=Kitasatospora sp. NPDC101183 TaxID=3364100 RepID=UPI00382DB229